MSPESPVLEVFDLHVRYEARRSGGQRKVVRAVDGVTFNVNRGEILALVGESGCGKTTIAQAVMRLVPITSGRILSEGRDLARMRGRELRRARRSFQMIFQDPFSSLDPRKTVFDTVAEPLAIHRVGSSAAERRTRVLQALEFAHLRPAERLADRYPHELSGGQRQRVAIATAMVLEPSLVVADEPVSMLDVSAQSGILKLMTDLRDRLGVSYLFITHDLSVAWVLADRIAVVYLGRVVEVGPSADLVAAPAHPYTRALLAAATDVEPGEEASQPLTGETPSAIDVPVGCRFRPRCPLFRALGEPERCRTQDPALTPLAGQAEAGGRQAACHFTQGHMSTHEVR
ncbi:MAG: oligopeptide/dipeptide ABC transporter ATP-binding protein [Nocardioidaceae bacterium]